MYNSQITKYLMLSIIVISGFGMMNGSINLVSAEDKENGNSEYKAKNYKSYSDYLVQDPLNYGIIESIDQSYPLGELDNYD
ncbi:MAG: hypothetical protein AB7F53_01305 [Nitrososphaeraceae archaeon]